ncbi:hypothetical protein RFI_04105 [Reticulomyxa filosa]|uniref:Peptidyl-prolyl cis-trans isomerase n=1 Tax=Reticulomyxa filosa TaxID=46433 RepID=X6P390_RETFI|nr:hypothetical protein RFI_04105 [Reticulomyxa filosa]|eukprot:ETO33005.1 hypothetical protein RFI_04105 [Reticulomyxa filosa]
MKSNSVVSNAYDLTPLGKLLSKDVDLETIDDFHLVECAINSEAFYIRMRPDWAPLGAARFEELVEDKYYDNTVLFRALKDFIIQFGISGDPEKARKWSGKEIMDDVPGGESNLPKIAFQRGMLSYAGSGPNSRETQIFFTLIDTDWLGREPWEQPFAEIVYNVDILDGVYYDYQEGPDQGRIWNEGYAYLRAEFPLLTYLDYCRILRTEEILKKHDENDLENGYLKDVIDELDRETNQVKDIQAKAVEQFGYKVYFIEFALVIVVLALVYCLIYRFADTRNSKAE